LFVGAQLSIMAKGMGHGGALSSSERALAQCLTVADDAPGDDAPSRLRGHAGMGRGNAGTPPAWLRERCARLERRAAASASQQHPPGQAWGWKEPNSHVVLDRLVPRFPRMK
jgi:hypothetical protein